MKIDQHRIAIQTSYTASESVLTEVSERWESSLQEAQTQQVNQIELAGIIQERMREIESDVLRDLMHILTPAQQGDNNGPVVAVSREQELELKRFGIPVLRATRIEERSVTECVNAKMQGCVKTSDGREIPLDVDLSMSQSFYQKTEISEAVFTDPLVVNFNGELPGLEEACFSFDIDCDGERDQISQLSKGNGFLALDKNENGSIDDGSELFGTESGDGFADLAEYDEDRNAWIDERDTIFDKLRIWTTDGNERRLVALGESGIGAIYLGSAASEFMYRDDQGENLGALRSTGMFLYENGNVGNVSQIDFARQPLSTDSANLNTALQTVTV